MPVLLLNILWKKSTAGIFVIILLAAGTFTLSGVSTANLVGAQTNSNNTSEIQVATSQVEQQQQQEQEEQKGLQQDEQKQQQLQEEQQRLNHPPRANAGSDKKVEEGANVILDARRSSDPDGDQISYLWRQTSGPRVTIENTTATVASLVAPDVNRDSTLAFTLTVRDQDGAQDLDNVKLSLRNVDSSTVINNNNRANIDTSTDTSSNTNSNSSPRGTTTSATDTPASLENTTNQALTNMQNTIRNNGSRATSPNPSDTQLAKAAVFTPQAISTAVSAVQADNIVNTRTAYDIIFRTASAGAIKTVEMTFPQGTNIGSATMLEVSGVGQGGTSSSGDTLIYTVANPVNVPINVFLRFEVWKILNPPTPGTYTVQVVTKDANGNEIDSGTSATYQIKQIGTADIAGNAITGAKILDSTITSADIAPGTFSGGVADNSVTTAKIVDGEVKTADIADNAITSTKIGNGQVNSADIAANSITSIKIPDGEVTSSDLADNSVTSAKIQDGQIGGIDMAGSSINSNSIIDGEVGTVDLAASAITADKIATDAVTADKLAGVSKLSFHNCNRDYGVVGANQIFGDICFVFGAEIGDTVIVTNNPSGGQAALLDVISARVYGDDQVELFFMNNADIDFDPATLTVGILLFRP